MDFRSSNAVAALALLIASGCGALFAPAAGAGERLDFSTPAVPLAVPQPQVETKETKKVIASDGVAAGLMPEMEMSPQEFTITKSKSKEKYEWDADSRLKDPLLGKDTILGKDEDPLDADDWLSARNESGRATNNSRLKMPRGWDGKSSDGSLRRTNESGFRAGQNSSMFGAQIGFDAEKGRDGNRDTLEFDRDAREINRDRGVTDGNRDGQEGDPITWDGDVYGRATSAGKDGSLWARSFSRDTSGTDGFNSSRFTPFMNEAGHFDIGVHEFRMNDLGSAAELANPPGAFPDNEKYVPLPDSQSRQDGEQFGAQFGESMGPRAWEQPPSSPLPPRSDFNPIQNIPSRVEAPSRPVNLAFPKRPGDPY